MADPVYNPELDKLTLHELALSLKQKINTAYNHVSDNVRHITEQERKNWNLILDYPVVTAAKKGMMSSADKIKLDTIEEHANNYVHPTNAGNKHIPSGGTDNQILAYSADGTAKWSETCNAAAFDAVIGTVSSSNRTIAYKPGRTKVLLFMWRNATVDNLSNFVFDTMLIKNMSSSMTAKEIGTMNSGLNTVCTISVDASGNVIVAPGDSVNNKYLAIWFN